jgi:hypothetical protein
MHFTLGDLVMDIAQNAAESGATVVHVTIEETKRDFGFEVRDNGRGMTETELERAKDPFQNDGKKHPQRRFGLGIPFLIQTAEQSGGSWNIESVKGEGTAVKARFDLSNVDTPPLGDIPGFFRTILLFPGPEETVIRRSFSGDGGDFSYGLRKSELLSALGDLESAQALILLDRYLRSMEEDKE